MKKVLLAILMPLVLFLIGYVFYIQQVQYLLPTPIPEDHQEIKLGSIISSLNDVDERIYWYHFFSPECPCSKFNSKHITNLKNEYKQVKLIVVVHENDYIEGAKELISNSDSVIVDQNYSLARSFGVYSTPQAVLVNDNKQLLYRGNYNKSRYCTSPQTNFVAQFLDSATSENELPIFNSLAYKSYGCYIYN